MSDPLACLLPSPGASCSPGGLGKGEFAVLPAPGGWGRGGALGGCCAPRARVGRGVGRDAAPGSRTRSALLSLGSATPRASPTLRKGIYGDRCEGARFVLLPQHLAGVPGGRMLHQGLPHALFPSFPRVTFPSFLLHSHSSSTVIVYMQFKNRTEADVPLRESCANSWLILRVGVAVISC